MLKSILERLSKRSYGLISGGAVLYTLYLMATKLATKKYGGNLNGLHVAPWLALFAAGFNVIFYACFGCFSWKRFKEQWPIFLLSGCATGTIIVTGVTTLALNAIKITEASALTKATAIPASLLAILFLLKEERRQLWQKKHQLLGGVVALAAIAANLHGIANRVASVPSFIYCLVALYALASFTRTPLFRKTPGDALGYAAGDQIFAFFAVFVFCCFVWLGNFSVLPSLLVEPFSQMREGLLHPSVKIMKWTGVAALPFALYAPMSILMLMYKEQGSTGLVGAIMQKLAGVIGTVISLPLMNLCSWLFFGVSSSDLQWYDRTELVGLALYSGATLISLASEIKQLFDNFFNNGSKISGSGMALRSTPHPSTA